MRNGSNSLACRRCFAIIFFSFPNRRFSKHSFIFTCINMSPMNTIDFNVKNLGKCSVKSPLALSKTPQEGEYKYIADDERILYDVSMKNFLKIRETKEEPLSFEKAGPKEMIYFEPAKTRAGIVTCGGLCPGLNNVIRSLVIQLYSRYKVTKILGFKYGYEGFIPSYNHDIVELHPDMVDEIHHLGGSFLGSSRGNQDVSEIVNTIERMNINILFCIGGDGTLRGAHAIEEEITKRGLKISVAAVPKTIDNDINYIEKTFGFETAFTIANNIIRDAHNEAKGAFNGVSIIKLMGRDSGFIAASAAIATQVVNFVLIPENSFDLFGHKGFFSAMKKRLEAKHHAVIVVAEGAGQDLFEGANAERDKSGNVKYKDIGIYLKEQMTEFFEDKKFPIVIKYIDPS
jgi:6-phosphofructokinase 1